MYASATSTKSGLRIQCFFPSSLYAPIPLAFLLDVPDEDTGSLEVKVNRMYGAALKEAGPWRGSAPGQTAAGFAELRTVRQPDGQRLGRPVHEPGPSRLPSSNYL